jgi:hypothetical protein
MEETDCQRVIALVCEVFGVTRKALFSWAKSESIFKARVACSTILKHVHGFSSNECARCMGKDRSSVSHQWAKHDMFYTKGSEKYDPEYAKRYDTAVLKERTYISGISTRYQTVILPEHVGVFSGIPEVRAFAAHKNIAYSEQHWSCKSPRKQ